MKRFYMAIRQRNHEILIAIEIGIFAHLLCFLYHAVFHFSPISDFAWPLIAARALLTGQNPYAVDYPAFVYVSYPLPAVFVALPFAPLPDVIAGPLFFSLSSAILAFMLTKDGSRWRLIIFLSAPYWQAMRTIQWSPLFTVMVIYAPLLPLVLIKPNLGLPLVLADRRHWTTRSIIISIVVFGISLALIPTWPLSMLRSFGLYGGVSALLVLPFGPLVLIALYYWRRYNARLLFLMSAIPLRGWYDQLPLLLIARSGRQLICLSALSWAGYLGSQWFTSISDWPLWMVSSVYLPALGMVLWHYRSKPIMPPS